MIFVNLLLAGGLLAAAAPLVVHILHRRRLQRIDWGAMRFLRDMLSRRRRRLRLEHLLLLLIRTLALLCLALALMRPQWLAPTPDAALATARESGARVAAVLLIDDGVSSGVGADGPRLDVLKDLARRYLDGLDLGDEVSVIPLSQLGRPQPPPLYDHAAARRMVDDLRPSAIASDHPALLQAGLDQLVRHLNPRREVVLFTDGAESGWRRDDRAGWSAVRRRWRDLDDGGPRAPQMLVVRPELPRAEDVAITRVDVARNLIPIGVTAQLRIGVAHIGTRPPGDLRVRVSAGTDGDVVYEDDLVLDIGERRELSVPLSFTESGAHPVQVRVIGARDDHPASDIRSLVVEAFERLPVLVVEGRQGAGLAGNGAFVALALQPDDDAREDDAVSRAFAVTRIAADDLADHVFNGYRCVILADAALIDPAALARLERAVQDGAGLLAGFSASGDTGYLNRYLARDGHGLLPTPLAGRGTADGNPLAAAVALPGHPALIGLHGVGDSGLRGAEIRRWLRLNEAGISDLAVPLRWTNGDPALVMRRRGLGRSALFTVGLDLDDGRLPLVEGWAPLIRGLVSELASPIRPPRNLSPGQRVTVIKRGDGVRLRDPDGATVDLEDGVWEGRTVLKSPPLRQAGLYVVETDDAHEHFAVAMDPQALDPRPADDQALERLLSGLPHRHLADAEALDVLAGAERGGGAELWPWLVVACLLLLLIEGVVAGSERRASGGAA